MLFLLVVDDVIPCSDCSAVKFMGAMVTVGQEQTLAMRSTPPIVCCLGVLEFMPLYTAL
jgi:hypothetical protein